MNITMKVEPIQYGGTELIYGKEAPEGVYFYTLDYNDNETQLRTNFIQIVR